MLPNYRKIDYTIWRVCERMGILPPGIKSNWDDTNVWGQSMLIAYEQIRNMEQ